MKIRKIEMTPRKQAVFRNVLFLVISFGFMMVLRQDNQLVLKYFNDSGYNFSRVLGLENVFSSPVNFKVFNGSGQFANIFSPWIFLYPMLFLISLFQSPLLGYYTYMIILTYITLVISYYVANNLTKNKTQSYVMAILYTFSTYRMMDIYNRVAMGEAISLTFLPFILLGLYQIFYTEKPKYNMYIIGLVGLVYSQPVMAVIALIATGLLIVIHLFQVKISKSSWLAFAKAIGLSLVLSLGYLVPMIQILVTSNVNLPSYKLFNEAIAFNDVILNSLNNTVGEKIISPSVGLLIFIATIVAFIQYKKLSKFDQAILWLGSICLLLSTKIFPWNLLQDSLEIIQFPWRFIAIGSICLAYVGSVAVVEKLSMIKPIALVAGLIIIAFLLQSATLQALEQSPGEENRIYTTDITYLDLYKRYDDYGNKRYMTKEASVEINDYIEHFGKINGFETKFEPYRTANEITYNINSDHAGTAVIPTINYVGQEVYVNDNKLPEFKVTKGDMIKVPIAKGDNTIVVKYRYTILARVSWFISLITLIIWVIGSNLKRRGVKVSE